MEPVPSLNSAESSRTIKAFIPPTQRRVNSQTVEKNLSLKSCHHTSSAIQSTKWGMPASLIVVILLSISVGISWADTYGVRYHLKCPDHCVCTLDNTTPANLVITQTPQANIAPMTVNFPSAINCSALGLSQIEIKLSAINTSTNPVNIDPLVDNGHNDTTPVDTQRIEPPLHYLNYSANKITTLQVLYNLFDQQVAEIPNATLQLTVTKLDLSYNQIQLLPADSFDKFADVEELQLHNNLIQNVSAAAFAGLTKLTQLDLSHNRISQLDSSVFDSLINLQILDLSHNMLSSLGTLHALSSLRYLYIQHNSIGELAGPKPLLPSLMSLIHLNMSGNPLLKTSGAIFSGTPRLEILDISSCSITEMEGDTFDGLPSLGDLNLNDNNLTKLNYPVFQNTSLVALSLASMPFLQNISHDAFLGLSRLTSLNLSFCSRLAFIQPNVFTPVPQLRVLDLSDCAISQLSPITFHHNPSLTVINLANNPLTCSCTNAWLAAERTKGNDSHITDAATLTCYNTTSGQGQAMTSTSFQCSEIIMHNTTSTRISLQLGSQLRLPCTHSSAEPCIITWSIPGDRTLFHHDFHPEATSHLLSPSDVAPGSPYHKDHYWHDSSSYHSELANHEDRVLLLSDGSLYIDYILRTDTGKYNCRISNANFNESSEVILLLDYKLSGEVKIFGIAVGFLCALGFFTLNVIYIIISWIARRLINKRRRETIRQMLENMNTYKSAQVARIQENYTHQLGRVRTQYQTQRDRLHKNYTQQVARVKGACSHQVERVRDNYTLRLAQLRDYSSNQVVLIRERANNQIVRIRDYGAAQLDRLRETYKLQHMHVMKLWETMNLDNCRHMVETECMRAESMMFDVDLLGDVDRTDSPLSVVESEYTTPDSSPAASLEDKKANGLTQDMAQHERQLRRKILYPTPQCPTNMLMNIGLGPDPTDSDAADPWGYSSAGCKDHCSLQVCGHNKDDNYLLQNEQEGGDNNIGWHEAGVKESFPLPVLSLDLDEGHEERERQSSRQQVWNYPYMTPQASPTKTLRKTKAKKDFQSDL